ncbi:ABC transporter family substrate-binding protein [Nocardia huaxiensis]|uniref:ABC transporter family substrate-binding protein n=1 Tax=Nocardia huaxiensis TaxID=2755382 RepID=A0A7D6VFJ5_9NOCA|nr:ABC transporter family substrate-binding protein [Nocardia huaxiensis]QLY34291.1 ABC transporter family substrate-binding protein [Nocardia huaxiensis]UFT00086.1 ABC transporter family substrate-binding protein [Nocardia huaxiensis]
MVATLVTVATGCTANPPPPIESTDSPKTTAAKPGKNSVVVAIDDIGIGFNPHLRSQLSPATAAVASMVLPSPFRPSPSPTLPGATDWILDPAMMVSADVTAQEPFTITYQIRNEASWSDGAPVAAEDFRYLWQQMITQPGTVDPAGYRMISDITSSAGGKTVTVTMNGEYPAWRQLFADLLPSHLVKDAGFEQGLVDTIRISGGQFKIKQTDRGREEILLERNDRYWGKPAVPDQILMRRGGTYAQVAESLRVGDAQMALVHGGVALQAQLAAIPSVRTAIMAQSREMQLVLNGRTGDLADVRVRKAVMALLDPVLLATVGAQTGSWVEPVRAQVLSPSDPGYAPTAPPRPSLEEAYALLAEAGFGRAPEQPGSGSPTSPAPQPRTIAKNGKSLTIRIGAADGDDTALAVANTTADQLRSAGIDVMVRSIAAAELYGKDLTDVGVDAIVGWERTGGDPATVLASRYSCAPVEVPGTDGDSSAVEAAKKAPSNLSGVCDPTLQPAIDAALRGIDTGKVIAEAEPKLWEMWTVLPIVQDTQVAAAGPRVDGASLSGAIQIGIFADAANWRRLP